MGGLASRQNATVEEADIGTNYAYRYPPRSGSYFGTHFIMGGERFDTPQPESYLFGENADLNFLGNRPTAFPYPPPQANEPTKTLKSLVNIRKESVKFVKSSDVGSKIHGDDVSNKNSAFNIEFIFDSDARCAISIYYFCTEEISANGVTYISRDSALTSETYSYKRGVNQYFSQPSHVFNPNMFSDDDLGYNLERDVFPIAIHCVVEDGAFGKRFRQSHTTICVVDRHVDGTFVLRALKQKIFVDGLCYLLQEIYGIENKTINKQGNDEETDDNGSECVICMSDTRDTLILPCRHLCLCNSCADSLRYQANNCPICRAPFRALLQIRAVQKGVNNTAITASSLHAPDANSTPCENLPIGYVPVSLIEALNGPLQCAGRGSSLDGDCISDSDAIQAVEILNKGQVNSNGEDALKDIEKSTMDKNTNFLEFKMSVLSNKEDKDNCINTEAKDSEGVLENISKDKLKLDTVSVINEIRNPKPQTPECCDDDSDTEKLSPLLIANITKKSLSALCIDGVEEPIDDIDTDPEDDHNSFNQNKNRPALSVDGDGFMVAGGEDSDYYTPEDSHTTILSPLCSNKVWV